MSYRRNPYAADMPPAQTPPAPNEQQAPPAQESSESIVDKVSRLEEINAQIMAIEEEMAPLQEALDALKAEREQLVAEVDEVINVNDEPTASAVPAQSPPTTA